MTASAAYLGSDPARQGGWPGAYGHSGHAIATGPVSVPPDAAFAVVGPVDAWTWHAAGKTVDGRAVVLPGGQERVAACWYAADALEFAVSVPSTGKKVSLYLLDWDGLGRTVTVDVLDATGAILDRQTASLFIGGVYLSWAITGDVTFRVTRISGPNAVVSGVFFDPLPEGETQPQATTASFTGEDRSTRGSWIGGYGGKGALAGSDAAWEHPPGDDRLMQVVSRGNGYWTVPPGQPLVLPLTPPPGARRVTLYFLDGNDTHHTQSVSILDPVTGEAIDARDVADFAGGVWLRWNVSGPVTARITAPPGVQPVLSGVCYD